MERSPAEVTSVLLARKGAATPAGFKTPPVSPPLPAAQKPKSRGFWSLALWLIPTVAIAVAATLTAQSITASDEISVAVTAPLDNTPEKIVAPVAGEVIEAPDSLPEMKQLAALENEPANITIAVKKPLPLPPTQPVKVAKAQIQIHPPVAARPVYRVQLHALGSKELARREWRKIKRSHRDLFRHKRMTLSSGKNRTSGINFVRLQAGPFAGFRDAKNLCRQAKKRRLACVVVKQ